jgi:hypothetical protein
MVDFHRPLRFARGRRKQVFSFDFGVISPPKSTLQFFLDFGKEKYSKNNDIFDIFENNFLKREYLKK